jgi:hypothetical protein
MNGFGLVLYTRFKEKYLGGPSSDAGTRRIYRGGAPGWKRNPRGGGCHHTGRQNQQMKQEPLDDRALASGRDGFETDVLRIIYFGGIGN